MPDFIRWLLNEPIVLLILIGWIFSMIGGVVQRAARKAQQERAREQGSGSRPRQATTGPARRGPDPEEIAREIRRAMGLEREQPKPRPRPAPQTTRAEAAGRGIGGAAGPRRVDYDELPRPEPVSFDERSRTRRAVSDEARGRRSLRDEMAVRDIEMAAREQKQTVLGSLAQRDAHLGEGVLGRKPTGRMRGAKPEARRRPAHHARGLLNLARPASAIVAMEVLGPPIALRKSPLPREV